MSTQLKARVQRVAVAPVLSLCLLLTLATGAFLASAKSLHSAQTAHDATPLAICRGSVGTWR